MCYGVPIFANNKVVKYGKKSNSHSTTAKEQGFNEDNFYKYEYHWWDKKLVDEHYDSWSLKHLAEQGIEKKKADKLAKGLLKDKFATQKQLAAWLKNVPGEWGHLMEPGMERLAKMVNPKLVIYQSKIAKFKKTPIEKYNPYQATKLPSIEELSKFPQLAQVWDQVRAQVRDQVRDQVWDQVWAQVWDQVWAQVWDQVWDQVGDQVGAQVRDQVWDQVGAQVRATSYWGVKITLGLPINHWFFDFLKLGVMIVFVKGKVKVFGKKGKFLGEYDESDLK